MFFEEETNNFSREGVYGRKHVLPSLQAYTLSSWEAGAHILYSTNSQGPNLVETLNKKLIIQFSHICHFPQEEPEILPYTLLLAFFLQSCFHA